MKKLCILLLLLLPFTMLSARKPADTLSARRWEFVQNLGQWDKDILYAARTNSGNLFLETTRSPSRNCILNNYTISTKPNTPESPSTTPSSMRPPIESLSSTPIRFRKSTAPTLTTITTTISSDATQNAGHPMSSHTTLCNTINCITKSIFTF